MDLLKSIKKSKTKSIVATFAIFVSSAIGYVYVANRIKQKKIEEINKEKEKWKSKSYDKVVLHLFPRWKYGLNFSPFNAKIEAIFRLCKVPYIVHYGFTLSPKQKQSPWMHHRGQSIGDSQFIYQYIIRNKDKYPEFKNVIDPDINLTKKQKATAHSFRTMLEEGLFFILLYFWWVQHPTDVADAVFKQHWDKNFVNVVNQFYKTKLWHQGIGRHTKDDIFEIGTKHINAIFDFMGNDETFFFGDTMTSIDCTIYSFLQCFYNVPFEWSNKNKRLPHKKECEQYMKRIENLLFPEIESWQKFYDERPLYIDKWD
eukprot:378563_1